MEHPYCLDAVSSLRAENAALRERIRLLEMRVHVADLESRMSRAFLEAFRPKTVKHG